MKGKTIIGLASLVVLLGCGCIGGEKTTGLSGYVLIDGSSTVYPITEAVAEEFVKQYPSVRVTVGISGTGGGFKKWVRGETDINDASRPIKESEVELALSNGIAPIELPVAYDGITVVVNKENDWVDYLTVDELKKIWEPGTNITKWSQIRPDWPSEPIILYGPGTDSGTFGYFTKAIVGEEGASRGDYTASEDDNVLVQGVSGDLYSLGYFGYAYYEENRDKVKAVPIVNPQTGEAILPSYDNISSNRYYPLSRPLFIYVSNVSAQREEVDAFVNFYLDNAPQLIPEVGYVPLPPKAYDLAKEKFKRRITGTSFGEIRIGISIEEVLKEELGLE
ncbi:protein sphX [Methanosarcinales archaeon]|nr:MAG: protein sphX [Methanosarcinales archaeon]